MKQDIDISNIESKPTAPKRDRIRIERKKYDQMIFDLKMAQTALDNRNKEIDGWVKQNNELRKERDAAIAERDRQEMEIQQVAEIGLKWKMEANQLKSERERLREAMELHKQSSMRKSLEIDRLQAENAELQSRIKSDQQNANDRVKNWEDNYVWATGEMGTLRDQRDMARFLAAMFGLAALGFSVAVWIGRLVPVT